MSAQPEGLWKYDDMVIRALDRLTHWAFPDSQVETVNDHTWQLWHLADDGQKYIDVCVELQFKKGIPSSFLISKTAQPEVARLNREDLDEELRIAICSLA